MSAEVFLDTNIFVYSFHAADSEKQAVAKSLIGKSLAENWGCVSYQVIQEFINVATRKFIVPPSSQDMHRYMDKVFHPLCQVFASIELYQNAYDILDRYGYSFYDALIIASAQEAGCRFLLTEDMQDQQKIGSLKIVDPFKDPQILS
jgi:predicted nucleic acid-binding protein